MEIDEIQFGFLSGCGTTNVKYVAKKKYSSVTCSYLAHFYAQALIIQKKNEP